MSTSPTQSSDRRALLQLSLTAGLGPKLIRELCRRFGSAEAVLCQPVQRLTRVRGISQNLAQRTIAGRTCLQAQREWERCERDGVKVLFDGDDAYPRLLSCCEDAPITLYVRGQLQEADETAVAIVGSRKATGYGRRTARRLAGDLARMGVTIVSGLARGIDAVAHRAALEAGGRTLAVLASPVHDVYPPEHRELADAIAADRANNGADNGAAGGAVLSEAPSGSRPRAGAFPQRNRLISGLSLAVVVVEATVNSGTLHTVRHALRQAREVFAVPGPIDSPASAGCHALLQDGAALVQSARDIYEQLPLVRGARIANTDHGGPVWSSTPLEHKAVRALPPPPDLSTDETTVLESLTIEPCSIDSLLRKLSLSHTTALSALTTLELKGLVERLAGGHIQRAACRG